MQFQMCSTFPDLVFFSFWNLKEKSKAFAYETYDANIDNKIKKAVQGRK